jgi:hypothetical protein
MSLTARLRQRAADLLWLAGLAVAVFLVYGSSLGYPFFWVDPIDIGLAGSRSISTILTNSQGYLYYRPFAFILWKLLHAVSGRYDPYVFHLAQVATHVVNVWLMYALAKRIFSRRSLAGVTALLFAWYPASYQAVTWVVAPQAQAMAFLLASALAYYDGRAAQDRRRIWLSIIFLAIALPFHENAVSFGFVIAALEVYLALNQATRQPTTGPANHLSRWPLAHLALCLAFAALWFVVPKNPDSTAARFEQAAGWYLLQGLIWPVAGAVGPWRAWLGGPAWQPLILVAPPTLVFLFEAYRRGRQLPLLGLGLPWFAVMVLPVWATRGISYAGISPRIFYVAAPGAILIWVGLLASIPLAAHRVSRIATRLLIGFVVIQSAAFLGARKELQDGAMPAIWDVVRSGQAAGNGANLLYINVPDQITPFLREYPVGFFRAILMPVSVDLGQYVELHTGIRPATRSLSVPALAGLEHYPHQVDVRGEAVSQPELSAAIRAADAVYFTEYGASGRVDVVEAGSVESLTAHQFRATFDQRAGLAGALFEANPVELKLTLTWDCLGTFDTQETIFVHLIDGTGRLAAQADGDPLRGLFPLSECRAGERIRDIRFVPLDTPHRYTLKVGMYNRLSGERLPAVDANGQPIPDQAVTIAQFDR